MKWPVQGENARILFQEKMHEFFYLQHMNKFANFEFRFAIREHKLIRFSQKHTLSTAHKIR